MLRNPKPTPPPDYDAEVLIPLRDAQAKAAAIAAEQARVAAIQAAQAAEAARQQQIAAQAAPTAHIAAVAVSGNCGDWIAAAGISDTGNATTLINWESGCNPNIYNRGGSGACGVAQELPCGKCGCALGDGACQVAWMNQYVLGRYGSWAKAVAFHIANNWY